MSDIRTPIIRVIKRHFGKDSVDKKTKFELVEVYFNDKNKSISIIEHFSILIKPKDLITFSGVEKMTESYKIEKQGKTLSDINKLFDDIAMPRKCVGVYFEGDYLNILIRG